MAPLIDRVSALCSTGQEAKITTFIEALERTSILPQQLQDKLNALGQTPIDEHELYSAIVRSDEEGQAVIALALLSTEEIEAFSAMDIGNFIHAAKRRITDLQLPDGTFKTTINTCDCKLPNFLEGDELLGLAKKQTVFLSKLNDEKVSPKIVKEFDALVKSFNDRALKISGLDVETLSEWEKSLVISQVSGTITNAFLCATGKA